jgi:hypothetical protein
METLRPAAAGTVSVQPEGLAPNTVVDKKKILT